MKAIGVHALLVIALSGCGADGGPAPSVEGTYSGRLSGIRDGSPFHKNVTFTLAQEGNLVSGTWTSTGGTTGTISGTVRESSISYAMTQAPCPATLSGSAAIDGNGTRLSGSHRGSACSASVTASFVVDRN